MTLQIEERVVFNPSLKKHREAAAAFMRRNAWADSKIKFTFDPEYDSVSAQIRVKLLRWYMEKDLGKLPVAEPSEAMVIYAQST